MSEAFLGQIQAFGFNFAPRGWASCDGQLLPISQYSALFSLLGTMYGGDGRTTFALPDLRGRAPLGAGQAPGLSYYRIGERSGREATVLTITNLPSHTHTAVLNGTSGGADNTNPANATLANTRDDAYQVGGAPNAPMTANSVVVQPIGGSQPISLLQPYLVINWCICTQGYYPPRS